jgi:hypothetical protein
VACALSAVRSRVATHRVRLDPPNVAAKHLRARAARQPASLLLSLSQNLSPAQGRQAKAARTRGRQPMPDRQHPRREPNCPAQRPRPAQNVLQRFPEGPAPKCRKPRQGHPARTPARQRGIVADTDRRPPAPNSDGRTDYGDGLTHAIHSRPELSCAVAEPISTQCPLGRGGQPWQFGRRENWQYVSGPTPSIAKSSRVKTCHLRTATDCWQWQNTIGIWPTKSTNLG